MGNRSGYRPGGYCAGGLYIIPSGATSIDQSVIGFNDIVADIPGRTAGGER